MHHYLFLFFLDKLPVHFYRSAEFDMMAGLLFLAGGFLAKNARLLFELPLI